MSNLSTFYKPAVTAADLNLGTTDNVTFASIQNTPIGNTTASTVAATDLSASGTVSGTGFSNYLAAPPAIGNTTPAAGTFTTLTANNGTITASAPVLDLAQTWNNAAVTFSGLNLALTNTASASASSYFNINLDGVEAFSICRGTSSVSATLIRCGGSGLRWTARTRTGGGVGLNFEHTLGIGSSLEFLATASGTTQGDVALIRDGDGTLGQRRGANPQTFNIYNTFTSATNHERGFLRWSSNVFQIGTEKGSAGGTARALEFQTDGVTRMTIGTTGESTFASGGAVVISNNTASSSATTGALRVTGGIGTSQNVQAGGVFRGYDLLLWNTGSRIIWEGRSITLSSPANGVIEQSSTTTAQAFRLFKTVSGTGGVNFERANFRWDGDEFIIDAAAGGTGTLRGIKLGSASTSLLGFFGATPVVQQAAVADATDAASTQDRLNDLLARLRTLGLIAT